MSAMGHNRSSIRVRNRKRTFERLGPGEGRLGPAALAQRLHQELKCGQGLPPRRIVEVISRENRAPRRQHAPEAAVSNVLFHRVLRNAGNAMPTKTGEQYLRRTVERQLAIHPDVQLLPVALELPGIEAS